MDGKGWGPAQSEGKTATFSMTRAAVLVALVVSASSCGGRPLRGTIDPTPTLRDATVPVDAGAAAPVDAVAPIDAAAAVDAVVPHDLAPESDAGAPERPAADAPLEANAVDALPPNDGLPDAQATDGAAVDGPAQAGPRVLSLLLANAPWYATQATQGIAVAAANLVYVGDADYIYVLDGKSAPNSAVALPYLSAVEAAGTGATMAHFGDFDIGPEGPLYVALSASGDGAISTSMIVRSAAPHQATPWVSTDAAMRLRKLAVVSDSLLAIVADDGIWKFTASDGVKMYSPSAARIAVGGCAAEDLAATTLGVFLYQPGCNGSALVRGNIDGTGVGDLYQTTILQPGPIPADNFLCSGRDPTGGFYVVIEDYAEDAPRLYHLTQDAQGTNGVTWIQTTPTFAQAKASQGEVFGFDFCSVAAGPDGTVFIQTYHQLWRVSP